MSEPLKPSRIIVSFRVGLALAAANIGCAAIIAYAWIQVREREESVSVKGSAKSRIVSDLIVWRGSLSAQDPDLAKAYATLDEAMKKTTAYLKAQAVPDNELTIGSIQTTTNYKRDAKGFATDEISSYVLRQSFDVESKNVLHTAEVSRKATELIQQGVLLESYPPQYIYTQISEMKIKMLAEATKDARDRADKICENSGCALGVLRSASMGVMQITAANSTEVADYGINDTSSYEKDCYAVVSARFAVD